MGKALMVIVFGFTTVFSGLMFNLTSSQQGSSREFVKQYDRWLKNNATQSVTNVAISKIYRGILPDTTYAFNGASCQIVTNNVTGDSAIKVVTLEVQARTTYAGEIDTTSAAVIFPAYSYYSYFVWNWPSHRVYSTGDTIRGPIHSKEKIKTSGNPVFLGRVSTSDPDIDRPGNPKFYGGLELETEDIPVPSLVELAPLTTVATTSGHVLAQPIWLVFNSDSTYTWSADSAVWSAPVNMDAYNGTIITTAGNDIKVRGQVGGRMTVISGRNIIIQDSLTCVTNPISNPFSQHYLGLIGDRIIIQYTSNSDITLHASLIARDVTVGSILLENKLAANADLSLKLIGSVVAYKDSLSTTTLPATSLAVNSFSFSHLYDSRLKNNTPPYYPRVANRIELLLRGFVVDKSL